MIKKEIYSPKAFEKQLLESNINCKFNKATLFKDYVVYFFDLKCDKINEFDIYSATFKVLVESESRCLFLGMRENKLAFLLGFTNDLKAFGLAKTKEKAGVVPKENYDFDSVKLPIKRMMYYKIDPKNFVDENGNKKIVKDITENIKSAEERYLIDEFWKNIN